MTPSATTLARTPCDAYSMASERVTAASPPLVRAARADGDLLSAWATRLVGAVAMWRLPWINISDAELRDVEEAGQVHGDDRRVVIGCVVREGLADEAARVVDQSVDQAETAERLLHHALGGFGLCDVARHPEQIGRVGG